MGWPGKRIRNPHCKNGPRFWLKVRSSANHIALPTEIVFACGDRYERSGRYRREGVEFRRSTTLHKE